MERAAISAFTDVSKIYCLLTKPGILMGNAITAAGGFALASQGAIDLPLFFAMLVGLLSIVASACVFNNTIDREADKKMARTKNRPLAQELIPVRHAVLFAILLGTFGTFFLILFTNLFTVIAALFGFFVYVILYSFLKYHSMHGTLIGSLAGAAPPVVGYCAVSHAFDLAALLLFILVALWQMPHFFAIAIYRLEDYAAASIPVLPIKKGILMTKVRMMLYIVAFMGVSSLLVVFKYTGYTYLIVSVSLGLAWLLLGIKGFKCNNHKLWARKMFLFSLVVIIGLCLAIPLSH